MTVSSQQNEIEYIADGTTRSFPIPFYFLENSHIVAVLTNASGADFPATQNVDYAVTGAGNQAGGSAIFTVAPSSGMILSIARNVPATQLTDYQPNDDFPAESHERALDKLTMLAQQLNSIFGRALIRALGSSFYDAKNWRIGNVADPINDLDATNRRSVRNLIESALAGIVGGAGWFLQNGAGAVARTFQSKMRESVSILDFGGAADGATDNTPAFQKAAAAVGLNGLVYFPGATGATYFFASDPPLTTAILKADPGVVITGPNIGLYSGIRTVTPITVNITGSQNYTYRLTPEHKKPWAEKSLFLTDGDIDRSVLKPILATGTTKLKINFLSSDTFVDAAADQTSVADQVKWNNIAADGVARLAFTPVKPGDELNACFLEAGVYRRMAMVRTSAGYYTIYADGGGAQPHYATKLTGVASSDNVFDYLGRTTHANVAAENSVWSIKIFSYNTFAVLFNGVEVTGILTVAGYIFDAAFGVVAIGGPQTLNINGWSRWQTKPAGGKRGLIALTIGDSLTADIHGGWPYAMREALNGSFGARIISIINQAVSGQASGDQLAILQANGLQNANLVFIAPGTNDIQFGVPVATYIANVSAMLDICAAGFAIPIVWVPQTWYLQSNSGGGGQATVNNGGGRDHRARLMRLCADRGVKCVDMMQVSGPILSNWLTNPDIDPWVRDNIHQTTHADRVMAYALTRAASDVICPRYDQHIDPTAFVIGSASNGWNFAVQQPFFEVSESKRLNLSGTLSNGTITAGTVMYTLPASLRPTSSRRFTCQTNASTPCMVAVGADGTLAIFNAAVGTTWVDLSPVSYQL